MVMTKPELLASLENETRILLHLASKIDHAQLDYRPTPKHGCTSTCRSRSSFTAQVSGPSGDSAGPSGASSLLWRP